MIRSNYFRVDRHLSRLMGGAVLLLLCLQNLVGQDYVIVKNVDITGNHWTRTYIVEMELDFLAGDTLLLKDITRQFEDNRNRLLNTGLFNKVEIKITNWEIEAKTAEVHVKLLENWFWYPAPVFELADRNVNEWLYQHDASFSRLNLGIRFYHINLTGNQDRLKFTYHTGFTNKYEVDYTFPYLHRSRSLGAYLNILYVTHKEVAFESLHNQLHFFRQEDEPLLTRFRTSIGVKYRKSKSAYHTGYFEYHHKMVSDTLRSGLNPDYFGNGKASIDHLSMNYRFLYTRVDKKIYPTKGFRFMVDARKDGFGVFGDLDHLTVATAWEHHISLTPRFSSGYKVKIRKGFSRGQPVPYAYLTGLGYYDDVLTGYQLYVVDGLDFVYLKTYQKFLLADLKYELGRYMPLRQFKYLPIKLYLGLHGDTGYAVESRFSDQNPFNNRLLYGGSLSLDLVIYENYFLSCEFTINHTGEMGIFLQGINTFE